MGAAPGRGRVGHLRQPALPERARRELRLESHAVATATPTFPIVADPGPFPGSNLDTNKVKPPYNFDENPANPALNLTFATQPLSFMGSDIDKIIKSDPNPAADLLDVQEDIREIASFNRPVNWGWYQQGFDANDALGPLRAARVGDEPDQHALREQRLCPASQRAAIFRLSRRQSGRS